MSAVMITMQILQLARLAMAVGDTTAQLLSRLEEAHSKNQGIDVVMMHYKKRLDDMILEGEKLLK